MLNSECLLSKYLLTLMSCNSIFTTVTWIMLTPIYLCGCMKKVHWQVIKISWACKLTYLMYLHIKYLHMMCELQSEMWMQLKIHNLHCAYSWSSAMKFRKAIACLTRSCFTSVKPFFFLVFITYTPRGANLKTNYDSISFSES